MTLGDLGIRMAKSRKTSSVPKAEPVDAETDASGTSSEQAASDAADSALSHSETDDSAALADAAADAEGDEEASEQADADEGTEAVDAETQTEEPPKAVRELQKQLNKKHAKLQETREELADLREEVKALRENPQQPAPKSTQQHPSETHAEADRSVQEIDSELSGAEAFMAWAEENPHGGTFESEGKTYDLTDEQVRDLRRQSERQQIRLNAKRETRLEMLRQDWETKRQTSHGEAVKLYPWVGNQNSPEFQEALSIIRENPAVLQRPDFELVVARQVTGHRLEREALKKTKAGMPPKRKATPVVTFAPSAAPKSNATKAATVSAAEKQFSEGGGREGDLSKLLAQKRLARQEARAGVN